MDGTIHRFEFTFELFWKTSRRFLQQEGIDTASPKSTYNAKMAREIFGRLPSHYRELRDRFEQLKLRVAED